MASQIIKIQGMECSGCVSTVSKVLKKIKGVKTVNVSLELAQAAVEFDEKIVELAKLEVAIEKAGYDILRQ
jgi:copper chaperone CopZ